MGRAARCPRPWRVARGGRIRGPRGYACAVKARVLIRPKEGILDPQGKAVERALPALGFEGMREVRVGRLVELEADDPERLGELCEKLLANPLVEDSEIEVAGGADKQGEGAAGHLGRRVADFPAQRGITGRSGWGALPA